MVKTKNIYIVPIRKRDRKLVVSDVRAHSDILKYALDFPLPEETPILAAKDGIVINDFDMGLIRFKKVFKNASSHSILQIVSIRVNPVLDKVVDLATTFSFGILFFPPRAHSLPIVHLM